MTKLSNSRPSFRGFERMSRGCQYISDYQPRPIPKDSLMNVIFSPNPTTGLPSSDLHIQLQGSLDPSTAEFVRRTLASPYPVPSVGHEDPDVVLDSARHAGESLDSYAVRLKEQADPKGGA